jgi:hypothetical protein
MNGQKRFAALKSARLYQPANALSETPPEIRPDLLNQRPDNGFDRPAPRPLNSSSLDERWYEKVPEPRLDFRRAMPQIPISAPPSDQPISRDRTTFSSLTQPDATCRHRHINRFADRRPLARLARDTFAHACLMRGNLTRLGVSINSGVAKSLPDNLSRERNDGSLRMGKEKMAENGAFPRAKSAIYPCREPVLKAQAIDLAGFMSVDFFGGREQEECRAPFSGEDRVDVTQAIRNSDHNSLRAISRREPRLLRSAGSCPAGSGANAPAPQSRVGLTRAIDRLRRSVPCQPRFSPSILTTPRAGAFSQ